MRIAFYVSLWFLSSGCAILLGGLSERVGVMILLWLNGGTLLLQEPSFARLIDTDLAGFVVDGCALPACAFIALSTRRHWTLWFCAAQIAAVLAHVAHYLLIEESDLAYAAMTRVPAYIQCVSLLIGALAYHRRALAITKSSSRR